MRLAIRALALWACMGAPAFAQVGMGVLPFGGAVAASGPPPSASYTHKGQFSDNGGGGATLNFTCDVGSATVTRVILVGASNQGTGANDFTAVSVNGVALTKITAASSSVAHGESFWYGVGTSFGSGSQTLALTGGNFQFRGAEVWIMDGLSSTSPKNTAVAAGGAPTISVTAGDFLFVTGFTPNAGSNYSSSTETPANNYDNIAVANQAAADWTILSTNASFLVFLNPPSGNDGVAVSFR